MNIDEIIGQCRKNSRQAQHQLFSHFYEDMMRMVLRYCSNEDDAKEAINDGFLQVFKHLDKFEGRSSFKTWITSIFIRAAIKKSKVSKKYRTSLEEELSDATNGQLYEYENVLDKLEIKEIIQIIETLPETEKIVFNLFCFEDFKHKEIGDFLGIKESTSRWYLNNARKIMSNTYNLRNKIVEKKIKIA